MNPQDTDIENALQVLNDLYKMQVGICIMALDELRSVDLTDKNIIARAVVNYLPGDGLSAEDHAVDIWVDRAEYVDETSFNLYVTQAEDNVLWNMEQRDRKPGRSAGPQQRITVRPDAISTDLFIPVAYLIILSGKLLTLAFPDTRTNPEASDYDDESVMLRMMGQLQAMLDNVMEMSDGDNVVRGPVS